MYSKLLAQLDKTESVTKQIAALAFLSLSVTSIIYGLIFFLDPTTITNSSPSESLEVAPWVVGIFIGPPIETLLFQTLLLSLAKRLTEISGYPEDWFPAFLATSIIFATAHGISESSFYTGFINTLTRLPLSIALALLAISHRTKDDGIPFMAVTLTHGFYNLLVFLGVVGMTLTQLNW